MTLPEDVLNVLVEAWSTGFTTKSDFARRHADPVAEASGRGLITTMSYTGSIYTRKWNITPKGCRKLFKRSKQ